MGELNSSSYFKILLHIEIFPQKELANLAPISSIHEHLFSYHFDHTRFPIFSNIFYLINKNIYLLILFGFDH